MTTLLVHITIKPGKADKWEAIMEDMVKRTFASEKHVTRYEYWKGEEEDNYYCLLSFKDKLAFYEHQMSEYHEAHDFGDVLAGIKLEYVDPVEKAGGDLVRTVDTPLPQDASEMQITAQQRFPLTIPPWWSGRK